MPRHYATPTTAFLDCIPLFRLFRLSAKLSSPPSNIGASDYFYYPRDSEYPLANHSQPPGIVYPSI
jgi:hypothetical protein